MKEKRLLILELPRGDVRKYDLDYVQNEASQLAIGRGYNGELTATINPLEREIGHVWIEKGLLKARATKGGYGACLGAPVNVYDLNPSHVRSLARAGCGEELVLFSLIDRDTDREFSFYPLVKGEGEIVRVRARLAAGKLEDYVKDALQQHQPFS